jgi:hypothetical protein
LGNADRLARTCAAILGLGCVALAAPAARASCVDPATLKAAHGAFAFRQTRYLKRMSAPLVSDGVAVLSPGRVEWRVARPVAIVTVITANRVTQSIEGGPAQPVGGSANVDPLMRSLGLLQIVSGDFASARKNYDLVSGPRGAGPDWRMTLTPKDAQAARFLARIEITGCERPAEVDIIQANGDHTRIEWPTAR